MTAGSPTPTALFNAAQVFQGTVCVPGSTSNPLCAPGVTTPGVAPGTQYQFGRQRFNDQTFPGFGAVLPFTLPVAKNFQYASATQANLTIRASTDEKYGGFCFVYFRRRTSSAASDGCRIRRIRRCKFKISNALPEDCRSAHRKPSHFRFRSTGTPCPGGVPLLCYTLATPAGTPVPYPNAGQTFALVIPGIITAPLTNIGNRVVSPAVANFFRPNAPNYFLAQALTGGAVTPGVLNSQLAGTLRTPGIVSPFGAVNAQSSDGNSSYNALNLELKRRFANNFTFLASYTLSHSIDDSSDLQTLLIAQDVNNFRAEKADSLFDQRHRFVFSGVLASPNNWRDSENLAKKIFADFTLAPIIEISSGRPFNIITNVDANNDQSTQTDRPSVRRRRHALCSGFSRLYAADH